MASSTPRNRFFLRRRFLVDPRLQGRMVIQLTVLSWAIWIMVFAAVLGPLVLQLHDGDPDPSAPGAAEVLLYLHARVWWILAGCTLLSTLVILRMSHQIAGPMVRIRRALHDLGEGVVQPRFRLRRGDLMSLEEDATNTMLDKLRERAGQSHQAVAQLRGLLEEWVARLPPGPAGTERAAEAERLLAAIEGKLLVTPPAEEP